MFGELLPQKYALGYKGVMLRYDMNALLRLEQRSLSYEDIFAEKITGEALCEFLAAGCEGLPEAPESILHEMGAMELWRHIRKAVLLALPVYDPLVIDIPDEPGKPLDMKLLRTLVCDVMRKPEEFFWRSTMRELLERWQDYAVARGFAKKPERMELFDMEGME